MSCIDDKLYECTECKEFKGIDRFGLLASGNIRKKCKTCRSARGKTKEEIEQYNQSRRDKYRERIKHDAQFIESKRAAWRKVNYKYALSGKRAELDKSYRQKIAEAKYMGLTCDLFFVNCGACGLLLISRYNQPKKCKLCESNKIRKKTKPFLLHDFICCDCNLPYQSTKANKGKCKVCARKLSRLPSRKNKSRDHIERAKKKGVIYERINPESIYKRDGYKCKSCSCIVVKSKTYQPNQATIDHVIPISKGGSHTIDNVVTMCMSCNSKKSAKVIQGTQIGIFCAVNDY